MDIIIQHHTVKPTLKSASGTNFVIVSPNNRSSAPALNTIGEVWSPWRTAALRLTTIQSVGILQQSCISYDTSAPSLRCTIQGRTVPVRVRPGHDIKIRSYGASVFEITSMRPAEAEFL
jgi:hypothetical protein